MESGQKLTTYIHSPKCNNLKVTLSLITGLLYREKHEKKTKSCAYICFTNGCKFCKIKLVGLSIV